MEHIIHELRLRGAGNEKDVCSARHGNEMWQMRLDYEGRDAEIGLVFIRDTSEKPDSCKRMDSECSEEEGKVARMPLAIDTFIT